MADTPVAIYAFRVRSGKDTPRVTALLQSAIAHIASDLGSEFCKYLRAYPLPRHLLVVRFRGCDPFEPVAHVSAWDSHRFGLPPADRGHGAHVPGLFARASGAVPLCLPYQSITGQTSRGARKFLWRVTRRTPLLHHQHSKIRASPSSGGGPPPRIPLGCMRSMHKMLLHPRRLQV
jgi:hypothetical protein